MSYTYFILASESDIGQLNSVKEVMTLMEKVEPLLGGSCFTPEAINNLCRIFWNDERAIPIFTDYSWEDGSMSCIFGNDFCNKVANLSTDDILQASVPWSEGEPWAHIRHNRMDLAGMLLDFAALCKQTNIEKQLYFLLSNED